MDAVEELLARSGRVARRRVLMAALSGRPATFTWLLVTDGRRPPSSPTPVLRLGR